jgi:hypothetical protein
MSAGLFSRQGSLANGLKFSKQNGLANGLHLPVSRQAQKRCLYMPLQTGGGLSQAHDAMWNFAGASFSVSLWFHYPHYPIAPLDWSTFFSKSDLPLYQARTGWAIGVDTGSGGVLDQNTANTVNVIFWIATTTNLSSAIVVPRLLPDRGSKNNTDKWHHVVGVFDQPNQRIKGYWNGLLYANNAITGADPAFNNASNIGSRLQGAPSPALRLREVLLYNRALTDSEIFALYQETVPQGYLNYWKLNENFGNKYLDYSANAKHFTSPTPTMKEIQKVQYVSGTQIQSYEY